MTVWQAVRDLFCAPAAPETVHDERVHKLRNDATKALAEVHLASKQSRRLSHKLANPEDVQKKIAEAGKIVAEARRMLDEHGDDPDDGLIKGMDRP